jgi:hypothetical protein
MTVRSAKLWLSVGWLAAMAPLVIVLILRQLDGFYGSDAKEVWSWFSQFVLPALTLLAGAWTVAAAPTDQKQIDNTIVFWIAVSIPIFYIVLLYVVIGKQPTSSVPWQEQFKQSALFLGIIQGLVIGVLGKFFIESAAAVKFPVRDCADRAGAAADALAPRRRYVDGYQSCSDGAGRLFADWPHSQSHVGEPLPALGSIAWRAGRHYRAGRCHRLGAVARLWGAAAQR